MLIYARINRLIYGWADMNRLLELVVNDDGKLSRTQVNMWIVHLTCLAYLILESVIGDVLSVPLLALMGIYVVSSHIDRMDTRRMQIKLSKEGAHISLDSKCDHTDRGVASA